MKLPKSSGFTLVEILLAVTIISALTGVVLTVMNPNATKRRAEDAIRLTNLQKLVEGLEAYRQIEKSYPTDTNGDGNPSNDAVNVNIGQYIGSWPNGRPVSTDVYSYYYDSANDLIGLRVIKSDGRVYKYRSATAWGKVIKECASTAVLTNNLCP